ncbi:helix-turn-helix domain-containing protein [Peptoniphilus asaccharolyticus]
MSNKTLGQRVKELRKQLNLSQEELAKLMGYDNRASISKIENDAIDLPVSKVKSLAQSLNTTESYLMGWEDPPEPPQEEKEDMFFRIDLSKYTKQQQEEMKKELEKFYGYLKSNLED